MAARVDPLVNTRGKPGANGIRMTVRVDSAMASCDEEEEP